MGPNGELMNYLAGLPFPMVDANDPNIAQKIMWNFQFGPAYTDDLDSQDAEIQDFAPGHPGDPFAVYPIGHMAVYRNLGREEVAPAPTDYDGDTGIMERMAVGPIIVPIEPPFWQTPVDLVRPLSILESRSIGPRMVGDVAVAIGWANFRAWEIRVISWATRSSATSISIRCSASRARFQDFSFKFLGERDMLAVVHAKSLPAKSCATDGGRSICPEDWEMRHVYVIEADARRPGPLRRRPRDRQADFVYRFAGMVYHRVGSIRPLR